MARVEIKTNAQLQQMARAGVITSRALDAAVAAARPGVTTAEEMCIRDRIYSRKLRMLSPQNIR